MNLEWNEYRLLVYGAYMFGAIAFVILINFIFLRFAQNLGIRGHVASEERWASEKKPAFGGISFYIVFLLSFTSYTIFFKPTPDFPNTVMFGLIAATALAFLMGLADDAFNTQPMLKLGVQIACGLILIYTNTNIEFFDNRWLNYAITILWVVGMMNSINMLDNMDAITALVSIVIIGTTLILMALSGQFDQVYFFTLLGVLASLIGFLFFNWYPSRIYMGDTGSQFLGLFLSFIGIKFFWNVDWIGSGSWFSDRLVLLLALFALPIIDTTTVVINRLLRGQSPMVGGKDHTTHSLIILGFKDRQVAYVFGSVGLIFGALISIGVANKMIYIAFLEYVLIIMITLLFGFFFWLNRTYLNSRFFDA